MDQSPNLTCSKFKFLISKFTQLSTINREAISGNLTSTISNRLPQFLFVPSIFSDPPSSKSNMYERNWSKFNKEDFMLNYFEKDLEGMLNLSRNDIDLSFNNFLMNMNELLNMHVPYRKLNI